MNFLRRKWNSTIRMRLTVLYAVAFFLAGLALIGLMYFQFSRVTTEQFLIRGVVVGDENGEVSRRTFRLSPPQPPLEGQEAQPGDAISPGADENDAVPRLPDLDGSPEIVALRAQIRAARTETLQRITAVSVASLIALSAIATVLGWLLAGQALRPLRRITATARGIADRNLHQRIALDGPEDEIKQLADTLDDMLERLDRAFDSQQRFIANASHELRTPLAINRTLIEVAMMKEAHPDAPLLQLGSTLLAVNQRHERLIDGLLMLASSEQEIAHPQVLDLTAIAEQVLRQSAEMARSAAIDVRSQLESATCRGDPVLIERLLQNLVDNAVRYNVPASGWVRVNTGTDATGRATISVENTGPLIPSYELPRLFEPFRRLSSTERVADSSGALGRRGAGLGLSIVRAIVASHGGQLDALPREEGGLLIRISLPAHNP